MSKTTMVKRLYSTIACMAVIAGNAMAQWKWEEPVDWRWSDTHGIINYDLAIQHGITDRDMFIQEAVDNFEGLKKIGVIKSDMCDLFHIDTHVDFVDYLYGSWDTDFTEEAPNKPQAFRETLADQRYQESWEGILGVIKIKTDDPSVTDVSVRRSIMEYYQELTSWDVVHDCSPALRIALPEKVKLVKNYLSSLKSP